MGFGFGSGSVVVTLLHCHNSVSVPTLISFNKQTLSQLCRVSRHHHHYSKFSTAPKQSLRLCSSSVNTQQGDAYGLPDSDERNPNCEGSVEENGTTHQSSTSNEMLKRLKRYGISGILSYGLLNTAYYVPTFLFVWFYVSPAPGRMGFLAAMERFLKVMAMVWAGSQVTKLARAGGALALAPFVDRGLSWFTVKFKFDSQGKAFMAIVGFCFGLAIILFLAVMLLSI